MILIEREKVCAETTDSRILIKIVDSCCISRMAFDTRFDGAKNAYSIDTESRSLIQLIHGDHRFSERRRYGKAKHMAW